MASKYRIDLSNLALSPGEGRRLDGALAPEPVDLGGETYAAREPMEYRLEISRTSSGHAFHLQAEATLAGPCMRCLADAAVGVEIDAREVDQPGGGDEELSSPYVEGGQLDVGAWIHDALILAAPARLLCRDDCAGLCAVCGASLNDADPAEHRHAEPEGPFAGLGDLLNQ
jgi:uncharacterized protein